MECLTHLFADVAADACDRCFGVMTQMRLAVQGADDVLIEGLCLCLAAYLWWID